MPVRLTIVSEIGFVFKVPLTVSTVAVFIDIIKDRHVGNVGVSVVAELQVLFFYKVLFTHSCYSSR